MNNDLKALFPALNQTLDGYPLCYLDTAATSQKPAQVLEAMDSFYRQHNANVHRAAHQLSARATSAYEAVRDSLKEFIGAAQSNEIIFTSGTTQSINMLAWGLTSQLREGDVILVDSAAHHANIVPWQELAKRTGAEVVPIPLTADLRLDIQAYQKQLDTLPVHIVALAHVSNVLGTVNDIKTLSAMAKAKGALVAVDGAQAIAHHKVNVIELGCHFYSFSSHKMYGPSGVGVLWGCYLELDKLEPMLTGGEMIDTVSFDGTSFGQLPNRLEAGTPPIVEVIGLGAALNFIKALPVEAFDHEQQMLNLLQQRLAQLPQIELYGAHQDNTGAVAFNLKGEHHQDVGILLDQQGVAIRCGHHCAQPLMQIMQISGCCRASVGVYTSSEDIDRFITALEDAIDLLG
ncbi:cysteine desulfurase [Shewanella submarina]|uniref:Cysteine desulfurase n=1 Tax=Shewanella submarina TaxID=2016376 RepID=A0ABV7GAK2_9GAMM|nr:cysteine desulfurase [Shewanella submarina]MCL1037104.1 cysteine desulfurase [Shewanella submarina]